MKKLMILIASAILSMSAMAQGQKTAHVNIQEIMVALPDYKASSDELERFAAEKKKELEMYYALYQEAEKKFAEDEPSMSDEIKQQRYQELMERQQTIQAKQAQFEQDVATKEQKLIEPIMKKVQDAIATVAKENGYSYVLDETSLLYFAESDDLNDKVKKYLGITETATSGK